MDEEVEEEEEKDDDNDDDVDDNHDCNFARYRILFRSFFRLRLNSVVPYIVMPLHSTLTLKALGTISIVIILRDA